MTSPQKTTSFACREVVASAGLWERGAEALGRQTPPSARLLSPSETSASKQALGAPRAPKPDATPPLGGALFADFVSKCEGFERRLYIFEGLVDAFSEVIKFRHSRSAGQQRQGFSLCVIDAVCRENGKTDHPHNFRGLCRQYIEISKVRGNIDACSFTTRWGNKNRAVFVSSYSYELRQDIVQVGGQYRRTSNSPVVSLLRRLFVCSSYGQRCGEINSKSSYDPSRERKEPRDKCLKFINLPSKFGQTIKILNFDRGIEEFGPKDKREKQRSSRESVNQQVKTNGDPSSDCGSQRAVGSPSGLICKVFCRAQSSSPANTLWGLSYYGP